MKKITVDKETEHLIMVVAPRVKNPKDYMTIMGGVAKAIDLVEYNQQQLGHNPKPTFVFLHDGVTSGSLSHVIASVNVIAPSMKHMKSGARNIMRRKMDLDLVHGPQMQYRWVDQALDLEPDLILAIDNGKAPVVDYALRQAKNAGVESYIIKIPYVEEKVELR